MEAANGETFTKRLTSTMASTSNLSLLEPAASRADVVYPESDGEPIGETEVHVTAILHLKAALSWLFRSLPDVYVAADMLVYYEEGEPASRIVPDIFVVKGTEKRRRRVYKLWEERVPPCLVVEVTSRSSRFLDLGSKRGVYEMLGVSEYLIFDPLDEYLTPRLQAFVLRQGGFHPAEFTEEGAYLSSTLPVLFRSEDSLLRVIDPETGLAAPLLEEATEQAAREARRAEEEARRAEEEARRAERLEAELERYRNRFGPLDEG